VVLGASFDTPAENLAFADAQEFAFPLLSDPDRVAGAAYEVVRDPSHQYAAYPERFSYLITPTGEIARSYEVSDMAGHAAQVLNDLAELTAG
jgi:thioredoxin-dependent peroxiredoxin